MKKNIKTAALVLAAAAGMLFASCGTTDQLYNWGNYQETYYNYVKKSDQASLNELLAAYDEIINNQDESRGVVPPGIYADYGYLLLQAGKTAEGKAMLEKELELYPESETFVSSILKRVK